MAKSISQEGDYSPKTTKKANLDFANLWNKTNVRIASDLQKTMNAEKAELAKIKPAPAAKKRR